MAQCNLRKQGRAARCGLAPDHPGACKFGDNPRRSGDSWVYTDPDGDTIMLEPSYDRNGHVYLSVNDRDNESIEIRKNDVQAFVNAVLEVSSRPPKCTRCGGSGKEPR